MNLLPLVAQGASAPENVFPGETTGGRELIWGCFKELCPGDFFPSAGQAGCFHDFLTFMWDSLGHEGGFKPGTKLVSNTS